MGGIVDTASNQPFAPFYNPGYWATGGKDLSNSQNPYYMSQYYQNQGAGGGSGGAGASGTKRTSSDQDPSKVYGTQGTPTGARRQSAPAPSMGGGHAYNTTPGAAPWQGTATPGTGNNSRTGGQGASDNPYGYASGPGILESWFNQRASGTDPGFEYAMKRGMQSLGNASAAAGNFNSGAARQQESDFAANLASQREGQLDALAGGASGERQGRLNSMLGQGLGLAGGQAGTMGLYDTASAQSNNALMQALIQLYGNKAGVDSKSNQQGISNVLGLIGAL